MNTDYRDIPPAGKRPPKRRQSRNTSTLVLTINRPKDSQKNGL